MHIGGLSSPISDQTVGFLIPKFHDSWLESNDQIVFKA